MKGFDQTVLVFGPATASPAMTALEKVLADERFAMVTALHREIAKFALVDPHAVLVFTLPSLVVAIQTIRNIRGRFPTVPVVALGHIESSREVGYLLQAGASYYASPPHATRDFAASLRKLERHVVVQSHHRAQPGLTLDEIGMTATVQGRAVALTAIECAILARLLREPGEVVSIDSLLNDAWPRGVPATLQALRVHIRDLRKKIERNARQPRCIVSVRGRGYTFNHEL